MAKTKQGEKMKTLWRYLLITILIAVIILIFLIQKELFIQEMNSVSLGISTLAAVLILEIISHVFLFKSNKRLAKTVFGTISAVLIAFASFANFAVMTSLSLNKNKEIQTITINNNAKYQNSYKNKELISKRMGSIEQQIKAKYQTINKIQSTDSRWMIHRLNNDIKNLNQTWTKEQAKLSNLKPIALKTKKETILASLDQRTGIPATVVSMFNKAFISILLSIIPLSFCYLLVSLPVTKITPFDKNKANNLHNVNRKGGQAVFSSEPKQTSKPLEQSSNQTVDYISDCLSKLNINRKELSDKLKITTGYLKKIERSNDVPLWVQSKLTSLINHQGGSYERISYN